VDALVIVLAATAQAAASLALALDPRWDVPFESAAAAPPGYDAVTAYVPLKNGVLVAVDLDSGSVRWRRDLTTIFTPETGGGHVFVLGDGRIEAVDSTTGNRVWSATLPGEAAAPLYWDTGWLIASTTSGDLAAFRASDGTLVWRQEVGAPLSARPVPALDRVFIGLADGRIAAAALATGAIEWERQVPGRVTGLRAMPDQLIAGTTEDEVYSFDLRRGRQRWRWRVGGDVTGTPAFDDRLIFFTARDNVMRAVDRGSGNLRWTADLPSRPIAGPVRNAEAVLVPFATEVVAFDPATGKAVASIPSSGEIGAAPLVRFGVRPTAARLVTISRDGHLQGFGLRYEPRPAPLDALPGAAAVP
jgi:outer membrane protein assembly factor BamB